jgi:outer membrane receptor protein involved in Fe transport
VLKGATFVASYGRFSQAPDFQYLVDAAFDDTLRTGRFRRGNPNLGFEDATQYEFSLRTRPSETTTLRISVFNKLLDGLVASVPLGVDPDSTVFGNLDYGNVKGAEVIASGRCGRVGGAGGVHAADARRRPRPTRSSSCGASASIRSAIRSTLRAWNFPLDYDRRHSLTLIGQALVADSAGPRVGGLRPFAGLEAATIVRVSSGLAVLDDEFHAATR